MRSRSITVAPPPRPKPRRNEDPRYGATPSSPRSKTGLLVAVAAGFEPAEGCPSRAFEARSFGRSDTPPRRTIPNPDASEEIRSRPWTSASPRRCRSACDRREERRAGPLRTRPRGCPPRTSTRWLRRGSRTTSNSDATAPALGSYAPNTSRSTRASTSAPAHIVQGSRVTTRVWPSSRHSRCRSAARRSASTSAWAVGSPVSSRSLAGDGDDRARRVQHDGPDGHVRTVHPYAGRGALGEGQPHRVVPATAHRDDAPARDETVSPAGPPRRPCGTAVRC